MALTAACQSRGCQWDLAANNPCPTSLHWNEGSEDPGGQIQGVSEIRFVLAVDLDGATARSEWRAAIVMSSGVYVALSFWAQVSAFESTDRNFAALIESFTLEDASGRTAVGEPRAGLEGEAGVLLPMALADCELGAPCHREFAVTVRLTERFVHAERGSIRWQASASVELGDHIGTSPECATSIVSGVTLHSTAIEVIPGVPGGGVVTGIVDAGTGPPADGG